MIRFDGQVAVVTGAGRGLGRAHALLLAARGAAVVVNDLGVALDGADPSAGPAAAVAAEIVASGGSAVADSSDVSVSEGGAAIIETAMRAFGRIDILVNNAGTAGGRVEFGDLDDDRITAVLGSHLLGAFNVTRAAWRPMVRQGYGRVVSTSSGVGLFGMARSTAYAAAKMGIVGLSLSLAAEGEQHGIKVNVVAPIASTRMADGVFGELDKHLDPSLVSSVVALLAHRDCPVNGRVLSAGGGRVAEVFIGTGRGYFAPALTPEDVQANVAIVQGHQDLELPAGAMAEVAITASLHGI
jgi:NAD(P)-dependent dehydrogenase (short-subunit alcohol dehydrogenase family)